MQSSNQGAYADYVFVFYNGHQLSDNSDFDNVEFIFHNVAKE